MDEVERQRELDRYRVVDSLPDEAYDDIVRLAAATCNVPMALISLIDRERQWFKARTGLDLAQTRRDEAFCDHALRTPRQILQVTDATADPRFASNPLVTGEKHVRFYAGMPLVTPSGAPIGTVCVLDRTPRSLNETQRLALQALARLTMNLMEARHRERELERAVQMQGAAPAEPQQEASTSKHCIVAILEVEDAAGAAARLGERGFERLLQAFAESLEGCLQSGSGDSVNRVSGCAELVAVLHADEMSALDGLKQRKDEFEKTSGLRVLCAASRSETEGEQLAQIYMRADDERSRLKDGR